MDFAIADYVCMYCIVFMFCFAIIQVILGTESGVGVPQKKQGLCIPEYRQ